MMITQVEFLMQLLNVLLIRRCWSILHILIKPWMHCSLCDIFVVDSGSFKLFTISVGCLKQGRQAKLPLTWFAPLALIFEDI